MDFILVPLVVGIITLGIYKLFELFVCKKERLAMIEKLGDKLNAGDISSNFSLNLNYSRSRFSYSALKGGCLMLGVGLGLFIGFLVCFNNLPYYAVKSSWEVQSVASIIYGGCTLLFGGLGLLTAFLIEVFINKKEKKD